MIPKKQVVRVIDARVQELLDMVSGELKKIARSGMLPAGVVLSGGGANLPGFPALVKEKLGLPVRIARPMRVQGMIDTISDPSFTVALGLVLWGIDQEVGNTKSSGGAFSSHGGTFRRILDWLKNFLP